ncbi:hypothetical protein PHEL85_2569 [Polaribacter sp. Hel1_85]|nr:hypothetical protein PHEL85_2569 [Polaribacter sp. Hel1_85]
MILVNGPFPIDKSGHQGGKKQNILQTNKKGEFKLYVLNSGEYEFILFGKNTSKKVNIQNYKNYELFFNIETKEK